VDREDSINHNPLSRLCRLRGFYRSYRFKKRAHTQVRPYGYRIAKQEKNFPIAGKNFQFAYIFSSMKRTRLPGSIFESSTQHLYMIPMVL